jgi:hypothetical protein
LPLCPGAQQTRPTLLATTGRGEGVEEALSVRLLGGFAVGIGTRTVDDGL